MFRPASARVFDYKVQRRIVGVIALSLAPLTTLLARQDLPSISFSYWTPAGTVFVGALCVVALFLAAYNGLGKHRDLEFWLAKAAGLLALLVALFPTTGPGEPPWWATEAAAAVGLLPANVHYGAAILLFAALTVMMGIFARRARTKGFASRGRFYALMCALMLAGLAVGLFSWLTEAGKDSDLVYWIEAWILFWFGVGWLVAGVYRDAAKSRR